MLMKATVLTLALLCAAAAYAEAPAAPPAPAGHGAEAAQHMDDLATLLDLTDAQKVQVQNILDEQHAKMRQSFEQAKASGTRPDWQQMKALHEQMLQDTLQKLAPVLSATQLKKFQIVQQHMMHAHMGHHMDHDGAGPASPAPAQN
jgi:Spy/CpxP family protein refolding chaperone